MQKPKNARVAVIQASSQISKNQMLFEAVKEYASDYEVVNFGCTAEEKGKYSYLDISMALGLLLASKSVDFVVTGCSSGQGMMLACNSIPGVLCGYVPSPKDAYLFAQINNGNAVSLPLGEEYSYTGEENLRETIKELFSEPFGQGYPKSEAERKKRDTICLKEIRANSQIGYLQFMDKLNYDILSKVFSKTDVIEYVLKNGTDDEVLNWVYKKSRER